MGAAARLSSESLRTGSAGSGVDSGGRLRYSPCYVALSRSRLELSPASPKRLFAKAGLRSFLPDRQPSKVSLPVETIFRLQDLYAEMQAFRPAQADAAALHFMSGLSLLLRADNAFWVGAVRLLGGRAAQRDVQHGWRGRAVLSLHTDALRKKVIVRAMKDQDGGAPSLATQAITAGAGTRRVRRIREIVDFPAFARTPHFRALWASLGIVDRLYAVVPINADAESYFCFDLERTQRRFSLKDSLVAGLAVQTLRGLHQDLLLSRGLLVGKTPLTPGERQVLGLLLGDLTEQGIGRELGLSRSTTHHYVCSIFRKLGVTSRHALMALWLSQ